MPTRTPPDHIAADGWRLRVDLSGRCGQIELYNAEGVCQTCLSGQIRPRDLACEIAAFYRCHGAPTRPVYEQLSYL